jgi:hypothetical protein
MTTQQMGGETESVGYSSIQKSTFCVKRRIAPEGRWYDIGDRLRDPYGPSRWMNGPV